VADNVTAILQGVLQSGTAAGRGLERPAAGKTGTAQDNKDAWFVGYTPTLSTAVWMGFRNPPDDESTPEVEAPKLLRGIKGVARVTGGSHPARIWQAFMRQALRNVPVTEFTEPAPIVAVADQAKLRQRGGYAPGPQQRPSGPGGDDALVEEPPLPDASTPTTVEQTTTTSILETPGDPGLLFPP
jgi:membrane peptidoglycan carboxypeptidase